MSKHCDEKWNVNYKKLGKFKLNDGHCMVPRACIKDNSLGEWVAKQRKVHDNNDTIQPDGKKTLDKIGFT
jgi:hypothetical protein